LWAISIIIQDIVYPGKVRGKHNDQREITIEADPPQHVIGDGELWGETLMTVKVLPRAVKFVVPTTASK
jgi:diacylglycerol kinase family enzyme